MSYSNLPFGITSFGVPLPSTGLPVTPGKYFFVDYTNGNDGNSGEDMSNPLKTVAQAYSLARTNKDDVIVLMGNAEHVLTSMLTVSKNRVHFVGIDGTTRRYGQNAKLSMGVTTAATDIAAVKVTGVRCSFSNIKFMSANTKAESIYAVAEGGEYTVYENCEFYKSTDLDVTGAAELLLNGDSTQFRRCTFGSTANARSGAVIRPCVLLTAGTVGTGLVCRDVTFEDCQFWIWCGNTANSFVHSAGTADVERKMEFKDCLFYVDKKSTATPAVAISCAASLTNGRIICTGTTAEVGCTALATATGVWSCMPDFAASGGSGLQAT